MSTDLEQWLARPTTTTTSTSSENLISFPTLGSLTTDWLKGPISSAPAITMVSPQREETDSISYPTSSANGIHMWLKSVEPFDSIEDDFELVDEDTNSLDDGDCSLHSRTDVGFNVPKLHLEEFSRGDLDIWLKKEDNSLKTSFKQEENLTAGNGEAANETKVSPDKGIWIISQDKICGKTSIAEFDMFNHIQQESNNLMDWVKTEFNKRPDLELEVYNPLNAWTEFQKSVVWIRESNPEHNNVYSSSSLTNNGHMDLWLNKSKSVDPINSQTLKKDFPTKEICYDKWLKKDNSLQQSKDNLDKILTASDAAFVNPDEHDKRSTTNNGQSKKWLLKNNDEQQLIEHIPPTEALFVVKKDVWLHKDAQNSEKIERPMTFSSEEIRKWLFKKN